MSILPPAQEQNLNAYVNDMIARAEQAPPKLSDFNNDAQAYDQAMQAYSANPLLAQVTAAQNEDRAQGGTRAIYNLRISQIRQRAASGIENGAPDPGMDQQRQSALMQSVMAFDIPGIIKNVLLSIPFVGDSLAAVGKSVMSLFKDEKLNPFDAYARIKVENAAKAAATNLGINDPNGQMAFVNGAINATRAPVPPANPQNNGTTVAGNNPPANNPAAQVPGVQAVAINGVVGDPNFSGPNGVAPAGGPANTPSGAAPTFTVRG